MAKAYLVVTYRSIKDPEKWSAYAKLAGPAMQKAGGRFIVRGMPAKTYEKGMNERVVIVEFDSPQRAQDFYRSSTYQQAKALRAGAAQVSMYIVEGIAADR